LLKRYKNILFEKVQSAGLCPSDFEAEELAIDDFPSFILRLKNSSLEFRIRNSQHSFHEFDILYIGYSAASSRVGPYPSDEWGTFDDVCECFDHWLQKHIGEYLAERSVPDLWEQISNGSWFLSSSGIDPDDTTFFTDVEKVQLRQHISEFRLLVLDTFKPGPNEETLIESRIDYLYKALERLNKFDWRSVAVNTVISIAVALSLNNEQGHVLLSLFKQVFMRIIHLLQ
jgi:hypothetical protein